MLSYGPQSLEFVIGTAAAAYTLTDAYGAANGTKILFTEGLSELTLFVTYTPGAGGGGNNMEIRVQGSPDALTDATTFYRDVTLSGGVGAITASQAEYTFDGAVAGTAYNLRILVPVADKQIQISVKETVGAGAAGTCTMRALHSGRS